MTTFRLVPWYLLNPQYFSNLNKKEEEMQLKNQTQLVRTGNVEQEYVKPFVKQEVDGQLIET